MLTLVFLCLVFVSTICQLVESGILKSPTLNVWELMYILSFHNVFFYKHGCLCIWDMLRIETSSWWVFPLIRQCLSLMFKCVSCLQRKDGSCLPIHSVSLYLFNWGIKSIGIESYQWLMIVNLVIVVMGVVDACVCFPSVGFTGVRFVSCVLMGVANLFGLEFSLYLL